MRESSRGTIILLFVFAFIICSVNAFDLSWLNPFSRPTNNTKPNINITYTQNLTLFRSDKYPFRLQAVIGCWIAFKKYSQTNLHGTQLNECITLNITKSCMKSITRLEAFNLITSLIGRNASQITTLEEILIDQTSTSQTLETPSEYNFIMKIKSQFNNQQKKLPVYFALLYRHQIQSQFDKFVIGLIQNYTKQYNQMDFQKKQELNTKIQQSINQNKYLWGFIPLNVVNQSTFVIIVSVLMVIFCTCFKYSRKQLNQAKEKANKSNKQFPIRSKIQQIRNARMTEIQQSKQGIIKKRQTRAEARMTSVH